MKLPAFTPAVTPATTPGATDAAPGPASLHEQDEIAWALAKVRMRTGLLTVHEVMHVTGFHRTHLDLEVQRGRLAVIGRRRRKRFIAASVADYIKGGDGRDGVGLMSTTETAAASGSTFSNSPIAIPSREARAREVYGPGASSPNGTGPRWRRGRQGMNRRPFPMLRNTVDYEGAGRQLELPDPTAAFHGGNAESTAAHDSIKTLKKNRRETLLALFAHRDWTVDELEVRTGWSHQGLSPRVTELKKLGQIVPDGTLRPTRSGRFARVLRRTA